MKKLSLILLCIFVTGCASVGSKSTYPVLIQSTPSEASFTVENRSGNQIYSGTTPLEVMLPASSGYFKNESYTITFRKDGFEEHSIILTSTLDGWYWGNLVLGGLIGMLVVDPATGAMYKLPPSVSAELESNVDETSFTDLKITTIDLVSEQDRQRLQRIES